MLDHTMPQNTGASEATYNTLQHVVKTARSQSNTQPPPEGVYDIIDKPQATGSWLENLEPMPWLDEISCLIFHPLSFPSPNDAQVRHKI